jgi:predicted Zn-ribbon and HTH transcriptional regulator
VYESDSKVMFDIDTYIENKEYRRYYYLLDYITSAVLENHLVVVLISGSAQGKIVSPSLSYGTGKTTLSLQLSHLIYHDILKNDYDTSWDLTFKYLVYDVDSFLKIINDALKRNERIPSLIFDDVQLTMGVDKSHDKEITSIVNLISVIRPIVGVLFLTAPHISLLCIQLRRLIDFNVIVPIRGVYEVQYLKRRLDFHDVMNTIVTYEYRGESFFSKLPEDIEERYYKWRLKEIERFINKRSHKKNKENKGVLMTCQYCGHTWVRRTNNAVVRCPKCKRLITKNLSIDV